MDLPWESESLDHLHRLLWVWEGWPVKGYWIIWANQIGPSEVNAKIWRAC